MNGEYEGIGIYKAKDGKRYEGDFIAGKYHGGGLMTWTDGRKYEGEW